MLLRSRLHLTVLALAASPCFGSARPSGEVILTELAVTTDEVRFRGTARYTWQGPKQRLCLRNPLTTREAVAAAEKPQTRTKIFKIHGAAQERRGRLTITAPRSPKAQGSTWLLPTEDRQREETVTFHGILKRRNRDAEVVLSHFYPEPATCSGGTPPFQDWRLRLPPLAGWTASGPGRQGEGDEGWHFRVTGNRIAAVLLPRSWHQRSVVAGGTPLHFHARTAKALDPLARASKAFLASHRRWLGAFPYPDLTIVESHNLHGFGIPGLITLNRPRQFLVRLLQQEFLNLRFWNLSAQIAAQWLGTAVRPQHPGDSWLTEGFVYFLTAQSLQRHVWRRNLFNSYRREFDLFSLTYDQMQEVAAAYLTREMGAVALTDDAFQSASQQEPHPLLYTRHYFALRYLAAMHSGRRLRKLFRGIVRHHQGSALTPRDVAMLARPLGLLADLKSWWTSREWPNMELAGFRKRRIDRSRWLATVDVRARSDWRLPIPLEVQDDTGQRYLARTRAGSDTVEVVTEGEPQQVELDPGHVIYDSDRFITTSMTPGLHVFPGTTNTIPDRDFVVTWLPYAFRRPGEDNSVGVQMALYRHIEGMGVARFEFSPHRRHIAYHLEHRAGWHDLRFFATKNYSNRARLGAEAMPWRFARRLRLGVGLRHERTLGEANTDHVLGSAQARIERRIDAAAIDVALTISGEAAPWQNAFSLYRWTASGVAGWNPGPLQWQNRLFAGALRSRGAAPGTAHFDPLAGDEANLRLHRPRPRWAERVWSWNSDLFLPLALPWGGDSFVLTRNLQWQVFHDLGQTQGPEATLQAAGTGLVVPVGGDVTGSGTFAVTHLAILAILHSRRDSEVSRRPGFLFNISAQL